MQPQAMSMLCVISAMLLPFASSQAGEPASESSDEPVRGSTIADEVQEGTRLSVNVDDEYGPILADEQGRALYILEEDPEGESTCNDACTRTWPPMVVTRGEPEAGDPAVAGDKLDTIKREDGHVQVTYDDQPLYYYVNDEGRQNATGHHVTDVWGEWYLVSPEGKPLEGGENTTREDEGGN